MNQIINDVKIAGTGSYVPYGRVTNKTLECLVVDTSAKWIQENLGILERYIVSQELTSDLAAQAARRAIEDAGLTVDNIDLIIVATATPDRLAPSTACIVQDKIKAYHAVCFDLNAVCSGFLFAMSIAAQLVSDGIYKNALIIGADTFSRITDWTKRDCVYFGDGAGAAVINWQSSVNSRQSAVSSHRSTVGSRQLAVHCPRMAFQLYSDGSGKDNFTVPTNEKFFQMNGHAVYETATTVLPQAINKILQDLELSINDIDYLIPHQPGIKVLQKMAEVIGLPFEKVLTNMDRYANTAGASIPLLLDEARRSGKLDNKLVLLAAIGSGWTWGVGIVRF